MSLVNRNKLTTAMCALALLIGPSAASAAPAPSPVNPWLAMTAMSSSSSPSTAAAAAAVAQSDGTYRRGFSTPALPALAVILATLAVAIWLLVDDDDDDNVTVPVSPT
jgi:hypothetical protein